MGLKSNKEWTMDERNEAYRMHNAFKAAAASFVNIDICTCEYLQDGLKYRFRLFNAIWFYVILYYDEFEKIAKKDLNSYVAGKIAKTATEITTMRWHKKISQ